MEIKEISKEDLFWHLRETPRFMDSILKNNEDEDPIRFGDDSTED